MAALPTATDLAARHQAAELAGALRLVLMAWGQNGGDATSAVRGAREVLERYQPEGPDLTVELQAAASLMLYRLNEVPRGCLHAAVVEAARNLREKLTKLGVAR